jgi:hypothetical protein
MHHYLDNDRHRLLRIEINEVLLSLGNSINKTIMWHMNNRGVFSNPKLIDLQIFYDNLEELLGPLSDEILVMTLKNLQKKYGIKDDKSLPSTTTPLERIQGWLNGEGAT